MQRLLAMKQARLALIRELYTPRHPHLYTFSEVRAASLARRRRPAVLRLRWPVVINYDSSTPTGPSGARAR